MRTTVTSWSEEPASWNRALYAWQRDGRGKCCDEQVENRGHSFLDILSLKGALPIASVQGARLRMSSLSPPAVLPVNSKGPKSFLAVGDAARLMGIIASASVMALSLSPYKAASAAFSRTSAGKMRKPGVSGAFVNILLPSFVVSTVAQKNFVKPPTQGSGSLPQASATQGNACMLHLPGPQLSLGMSAPKCRITCRATASKMRCALNSCQASNMMLAAPLGTQSHSYLPRNLYIAIENRSENIKLVI